MSTKRKHYLDNLRIITVLLVMLYHSAYIFNGVGVPGGFSESQGFWLADGICTLIYPWFMVLLFCISGVAARHSIAKRGFKGFIFERTNKLLVPATIGLFVIHWISGYINIKVGGGLEYMPSFLIYPISVLSGTGPLWFAQVLYIFSILCKLLIKLNDSRIDKWCKNANPVFILLLCVFIWGGAQVLNMPVITVYRFGIYFIAFIIGYLLLYHDEVIDKVTKMWPLTLLLSLISGGVYIHQCFGSNYAQDEVLRSPLTNVYLWMSILAILAFGKKFLNKTNAVWEYLRKNSFGLYVLHYLPIITAGYVLNYYTSLPCALCIVFTFIIDIVITPTLNLIIERIPILRYCVLGVKGGKSEIQADN